MISDVALPQPVLSVSEVYDESFLQLPVDERARIHRLALRYLLGLDERYINDQERREARDFLARYYPVLVDSNPG